MKVLESEGRPAVVAVFLIAACLAVYWRVAQFDFVDFDDPAYIYANHQLKKGLTGENVAWAFTTNAVANWHPLTWLSFLLDYELFDLNAGGYHATNLLFHIANVLLLFFVLRAMTGGLWRSAAVAALFALHPLHVESVAWVSERKDMLSTFFMMLALLAYTSYARHPRARSYLLVALCFALGLLAKPMLVTLPCLLLLLDYWPLGRLSGEGGWSFARGWGLVREKLPLFALSAASCALTVWAQSSSGAIASLTTCSFPARVSNALTAYAAYLVKTVWPANLAIFYPLDCGAVGAAKTAAAGTMLATISLVALWRARRQPYLITGWLWYLGTLLPVIGLVQVGSQSMADRYTYVPLIGVFIMLTWGVADALPRWRFGQRALPVAAAMCLAILGSVAWMQVGHWRNSETLWQHALDSTPSNATALNAMGKIRLGQDRHDEAVDLFSQALDLEPSFKLAHNNMGNVRVEQGRYREAVVWFKEARALDPSFPAAHSNLGWALFKMGETQQAIDAYREAIRLDPVLADAYNNLGIALRKQGRLEEAVAAYLDAVAANPQYGKAYRNLGTTRISLGDFEGALSAFQEALRLDPGDAKAHDGLGVVRMRQGDLDGAVAAHSEAVRLDPELAEAHNNLGSVLARQRKFERAMSELNEAIRLDPNMAKAHNNLGSALANQGNYAEAIAALSEALRIDPDYEGARRNLEIARGLLEAQDEE